MHTRFCVEHKTMPGNDELAYVLGLVESVNNNNNNLRLL